jgi:hypothetical protein
MGHPRKPAVIRESAAEQLMRDQEVLRANRELTAYFKGRRTEREARAALKIIKAFVRDRERRDATSRPPLPGANVEKTPNQAANRKPANDGGKRSRRKAGRNPRGTSSKRVTAAIDSQVYPEPQQSPESHEPTPE